MLQTDKLILAKQYISSLPTESVKLKRAPVSNDLPEQRCDVVKKKAKIQPLKITTKTKKQPALVQNNASTSSSIISSVESSLPIVLDSQNSQSPYVSLSPLSQQTTNTTSSISLQNNFFAKHKHS